MKIIVITNHLFSLPSLQALVEKEFLEGIVTASSNKDLLNKLNQLKETAGIPLLQLGARKMEQQLGIFLKKQKAEVVLVFGFSYKISTKLLQIPRWGFINFHPSQLPEYRGPNPAFWQIKNQVKKGGITAHKMDERWDTGELIGVLPIPISSNMTASGYLSEAAFYAAQLMNMVLSVLQLGQLPSHPQDKSKATYQKSPNSLDLKIRWSEQSAEEIKALVNACNRDLGGAITFLRNNPLQILQVSILERQTTEEAGTILEFHPLTVACRSDQVLAVEIVQVAEGIMTGTRFVELAQVKENEKFG